MLKLEESLANWDKMVTLSHCPGCFQGSTILGLQVGFLSWSQAVSSQNKEDGLHRGLGEQNLCLNSHLYPWYQGSKKTNLKLA